MKKVVLALALAQCLSCVTEREIHSPPEMDYSQLIKDYKSGKLDKLASRGDAKAAGDLALYYYAVRDDEKRGAYWSKIALERGDPSAM